MAQVMINEECHCNSNGQYMIIDLIIFLKNLVSYIHYMNQLPLIELKLTINKFPHAALTTGLLVS